MPSLCHTPHPFRSYCRIGCLSFGGPAGERLSMTPAMIDYEAQSGVVTFEVVAVSSKRFYRTGDGPYLFVSRLFKKVELCDDTVVIVYEEKILVGQRLYNFYHEFARLQRYALMYQFLILAL
jgi:hypothetical protein